MTTTNVIRYGSRTFSEIRDDLISMIRRTYPEVLNDFTDSSVGAMLIDLNAGIGNNLAINTDRVFQETQLEYAQLRGSILNIAKNMGFNVTPRRPSVTVVDLTITVPVSGDGPDTSYYPKLATGAQIVGGGKTFETQDEIDWNSSISTLGDPNRSILPNLDSNGIIVGYKVTKREVVINGATSILKRVIKDVDIYPFFTITLPDPNIIGIENVILLEGTTHTILPPVAEFYSTDNRYYEVNYLAQQTVFVENPNAGTDTSNTGGIKPAQWLDVTKKFIKEYTSNGYCRLTFGSGDADVDAFRDGLLREGVNNRYFLENFLNNTALGEKLRPNYTLFIRYRTGGGSSSNVGAGTLTSLGSYTLTVDGSRQDYNQNVRRSLSVTNSIPAIGGNDGLSTEQIRQLVKYNFSSQERDITLTDYVLQIYKMPGKFGSPFRANAFKENNKIVLSILGIGSDGKLSNTSNSLLKINISEYLSGFRAMNDFVEIKDGKIFNLGFDINVYVENISDTQIANNIVNTVKSYFDINNHEMNSDIFLGDLQKEILGVNGVFNVIDIKTYNKVGGNYSLNAVSQAISNTTTGEITIVNNTIYSTEDSMFEIKHPNKDIRIYLRKSVS